VCESVDAVAANPSRDTDYKPPTRIPASMTDDVLEAVREDNRTALSRLGSSKALYADTMGEMEPAAVFRGAATAADAAAATFEEWADDGPGTAAYRETASEERAHGEELIDRFEGDLGEPSAVYGYLDGLEDPVERAGGLAGWALVAGKGTDQRTAFFVGEADPTTAGLFREHGSVRETQLERAADLVGTVADAAADRERAREAATGAIQAAYEEYTERLESMGVNPKPVC